MESENGIEKAHRLNFVSFSGLENSDTKLRNETKLSETKLSGDSIQYGVVTGKLHHHKLHLFFINHRQIASLFAQSNAKLHHFSELVSWCSLTVTVVYCTCDAQYDIIYRIFLHAICDIFHIWNFILNKDMQVIRFFYRLNDSLATLPGRSKKSPSKFESRNYQGVRFRCEANNDNQVKKIQFKICLKKEKICNLW